MSEETLIASAAPTPCHTPAIFRYRIPLFALLYFLGFDAPWSRYLGHEHALSTVWIQLSALLARTGLLTLESSTALVTAAAILAALVGASIRVWAKAYLGTGVMNDQELRADRITAAGPYRYVRNPLYLGTFFHCAAASILMPVSGAIAFQAGLTLLTVALLAAEQPHLEKQFGAAYAEYRAQVPAFLPAIRSNMLPSSLRPHWFAAIAAESFHLGFALCLLVLGWQYNVDLLLRCLLICFGLSLIANGLFSSGQRRLAT